ncbi:hypothetical protein C5B42_05165 [Candidatus Cerribacteria bacterium 'Amazon FNV 2010 28 9']|uniref:Uncharacterized protein n=1 Tax=Candidatus Cerribacteria bacterium 'Amazon FNV 2010 28 9' TaxID=2081795 RepID=A0A317JMZ2_9BACT|nr:MAG: hypothetical protein C5B42_05165 [Candidatus Cerribacteria bacterium 'Amazon FNV 2010 28 9']
MFPNEKEFQRFVEEFEARKKEKERARDASVMPLDENGLVPIEDLFFAAKLMLDGAISNESIGGLETALLIIDQEIQGRVKNKIAADERTKLIDNVILRNKTLLSQVVGDKEREVLQRQIAVYSWMKDMQSLRLQVEFALQGTDPFEKLWKSDDSDFDGLAIPTVSV